MISKTGDWNGHEIRFVWYENEWRAVLADIATALDLTTKGISQHLPKGVISNCRHYVPHYHDVGLSRAVHYGHCSCPRNKLREPNHKTCERYERKVED